MNHNRRKVLVVAVHPDDETLGCGGTILKHRANGDEIHWLIMTSVRHHPKGLFNEEYVLRRENVIKKVAEAYGFNHVHDLDFPTTMLDSISLGDIVSKVSVVLDNVRPEIVYMMFQNDVHSDHRTAFQAVYSCLKSFRRPFIKSILMFEALSETEFAVSASQLVFVPNVFIDVSDFFDEKIKIMKMYDTEIMDEPYPRSISSLEALARFRGTRAGVKYAEAFMLLYCQL